MLLLFYKVLFINNALTCDKIKSVLFSHCKQLYALSVHLVSSAVVMLSFSFFLILHAQSSAKVHVRAKCKLSKHKHNATCWQKEDGMHT